MTIKRYFESGTMTSSCFLVRSRSSFNSSCTGEAAVSMSASVPPTSCRANFLFTYLGIYFLDEGSGRADEAPYQTGQVFGALGLAGLIRPRPAAEGASGLPVGRSCRPDRGYLAAGLEDGARASIKHDGGFYSRLLGQSAQSFVARVCARRLSLRPSKSM